LLLDNETLNEEDKKVKSEDVKKDKPLKFTFKEQKEFNEIDGIIEQKETELEEVNKKINGGSSDFEYLQKLVQQQKGIEIEIESLMLRWTYLSELDEEIEARKNN
jgi:ATP-binding cassette subfamily F protein uup